MIYLIKISDKNIGKIGYTKNNPKNRLSSLQTGSIELLHVEYLVEGERSLETELHEKFKQYRLTGEWFELNNEIIDYFKNCDNLRNNYFDDFNHNFKVNNVVFWKFLAKYLSPVEYMIAHRLGTMAKANTNSLEPLSDETTMVQLMTMFEVSKNVISPILKKLHNLGVYAKFDVVKEDKPYTKFWIFNPYLLFSGKITDSDIAELFIGTRCERAHHDDSYELSLDVVKELKLKNPSKVKTVKVK